MWAPIIFILINYIFVLAFILHYLPLAAHAVGPADNVRQLTGSIGLSPPRLRYSGRAANYGSISPCSGFANRLPTGFRRKEWRSPFLGVLALFLLLLDIEIQGTCYLSGYSAVNVLSKASPPSKG